MAKFSKLIYKLGGYDYKVIEKINPVTTHFGLRYRIPGLSLLIVFLTAGYGGWHFTATLIDHESSNYNLWHFFGTLFFAFFIFFIDFLILNAGKNCSILIARFTLSVSLGSIIATLTTLSFFADAIEGENETQRNLRINPIDSLYDLKLKDVNTEINTLENRIQALRDTAVAENQGRTKSKLAGEGRIWREIHENIKIDSNRLADLRTNKSDEIKKIEADRKREKEKIEREFSSHDFISQVKSLRRLMTGEWVVLIYTIIFLVSLIISDLIPLLAKISKDSSKAKEKEYDPYLEYVDSEQLKNKINAILLNDKDLDLIKLRLDNDFELAKFNEEALKEMNSLYALEKYNKLLVYFKNKGVPEDAIKKIFDLLHKKESGEK